MKKLFRILFVLELVVLLVLGIYLLTRHVGEDFFLYPTFELTPSQTPQFDGIVRIKTVDAFCSGVVISSEWALTAAHCYTEGANKDVFISDTKNKYTTKGKFVSLSHAIDVALIRGSFHNFKNYTVDFDGRLLQQPLLAVDACGYPAGDELFCSRAFYNGNWFFKLRFSGGMLQKGMSGGPMFAIDPETQERVVVGINSAVFLNYILGGPVVGLRKVLWLD